MRNKKNILMGMFLFLFVCVGCNSFNFIELSNWSFTSGVLNNTIVVNYQDEEVICKISCKNGKIAAKDYAVPIAEVVVGVNQKVSWVPKIENSNNTVNNDYITILLLKKEKVIGYAVLKVELKEDAFNYQPKILIQELLQKTLSENETMQKIENIIQKEKNN